MRFSVAFCAQHFLPRFFRVDTKSKRHGGELVASVLKEHDVKEVFTLCGGHISPILVMCEQLGIRVLDTRHEVTCVFAADAVARLRQSIGVAAVTSGPGVTNTITALKNAQLAESPVLLIGGAAPSLYKGRGALQDIDQMSVVRSLCKFTARVSRIRDIVPTLRQAIATAQSGTPGPVFVEFPLDVLQPFETALRDASILSGKEQQPVGLKKKLINAYQQAYTTWQFAQNPFGLTGAELASSCAPLPIQHLKPSEGDVERVADMLAGAKRPLLLMGSQATLPPVLPQKLVEIVKSLGLPVFLGGMTRGMLGPNCPLQMRQDRSVAIREADVILLAGAVCDFRLKYGRSFQPGTKVVSINRSREQLYKNHGVFWTSAAALHADVGLTLSALHETLQKLGKSWMGASEEWLSTLRARDQRKEAGIAKKAEEPTKDGHMNPLRSLEIIQQSLPTDAIIVADGGDYVGTAAYILRPGGPLQWLDPGAYGTLGVGAGFALGAKAVHPERPVVIVYGDGACGYSLIEFDTFVRHRLPVVGIVGNDACWTQIAREQVPLFKSTVACNLEFTHYEQSALGLGANGSLVESCSAEELERKIRDAVTASMDPARRESSLINVLVGKTDFREGSISV